MCFFFSLLPATFWLVVGFFVLIASAKAHGGLRRFGHVLAIWLFVVAAFLPTMGAYVSVSGLCPIEKMMETLPSEPTLPK
jgi:hypothetical protein